MNCRHRKQVRRIRPHRERLLVLLFFQKLLEVQANSSWDFRGISSQRWSNPQLFSELLFRRSSWSALHFSQLPDRFLLQCHCFRYQMKLILLFDEDWREVTRFQILEHLWIDRLPVKLIWKLIISLMGYDWRLKIRI